jgi:hypothetical protein
VDRLHALMIGLEPDLTFVIDMDPEGGAGARAGAPLGRGPVRIAGRRFSGEAARGFLALAQEYPDRVRLIDGNRADGDRRRGRRAGARAPRGAARAMAEPLPEPDRIEGAPHPRETPRSSARRGRGGVSAGLRRAGCITAG